MSECIELISQWFQLVGACRCWGCQHGEKNGRRRKEEKEEEEGEKKKERKREENGVSQTSRRGNDRKNF